MFVPQRVIRRKRDGGVLTQAEIAAMVDAITTGAASDAQVAAFAMAVLLRGMTRRESVALTASMAASGQVLDWADIDLPGPRLDKHSTGGVGDKPSLVLAPLLAACGAYVPMVSGRGLAHTGGTLDKLEAIPGYDVNPDIDRFQGCVRVAGCAIVGAGPELAPADRRLYAIRDVTATVESMPLIVSSILAKKLASGLDALVLDVKYGSGSFAGTEADAVALAQELVDVSKGAGLPACALVSDMGRVLGRSAGNALEMNEAIAFLCGRPVEPRLRELTIELGVEALLLGKLACDAAAARRRLEDALGRGAAAERFARMVAALGGPGDLLEHPQRYLAAAPVRRAVFAKAAGRVARVDVRALGFVIVGLGGGRKSAGDRVDASVGLTEVVSCGEVVGPERMLALVHAASDIDADRAAGEVRAAFDIDENPSDATCTARPLILQRVT